MLAIAAPFPDLHSLIPAATPPHLFCVSRAPWHRLRRANRAPEDPAFALGSAGLSRRRPLRQSVMAGRALPMTIKPSRSSEANTPPEHRCTFASPPRAIALQMPSPTNRPCSLTVKAHAIAWSIRPPSASSRMPSAGLSFPLGTRIHPARAARVRPFATRVTATHVSSLASRTFAKNRAHMARPAKQFRFLFSGGIASHVCENKALRSGILAPGYEVIQGRLRFSPCHGPEPSRPPCHKARHRVSPKT